MVLGGSGAGRTVGSVDGCGCEDEARLEMLTQTLWETSFSSHGLRSLMMQWSLAQILSADKFQPFLLL